MKYILILDIDGVLITTPLWKADLIHEDGYSDFNKAAIENINRLLQEVGFEIWLSSSRRTVKSLIDFNAIFKNRGIIAEVKGFLPVFLERTNRLTEINKFLDTEVCSNYLILDDDSSLNELLPARKKNWIRTNALIGFNAEKLEEAFNIVKSWNQAY